MTAGTDFGGAGNTLLDLTIFLLLGEFVLDVKLGFVDEGLFFEVEVVLGLCFFCERNRKLGRCCVRMIHVQNKSDITMRPESEAGRRSVGLK